MAKKRRLVQLNRGATEHRMAASACPHCSAVLDRATGTIGGRNSEEIEVLPSRSPNPGDFTVCLHCGHVVVFNDKLQLRPITPNDHARYLADPQLAGYFKQMIATAQEIRLRRFGAFWKNPPRS